MPRLPSPRATQDKRWRFLQMTTLTGFIRADPLLVSCTYRQFQVPHNSIMENTGNNLCLSRHFYVYASTEPANPGASHQTSHCQEASGSYQPPVPACPESPQVPCQSIAKPQNIDKLRLKSLLNWEPAQYAAVQVGMHQDFK